MEDQDNFDEEAMMKDFEKELKKNEQKGIDSSDNILNAEDMEKLKNATHDKRMLIDEDGEIHRVAEIEFIIQDVLKHQNNAFKLSRKREGIGAEEEVEQGEENSLLEKKEFKITGAETSALEYTNQKVISSQRGILLYLAKKIGVNLLTGKSIMNVSLPIKIFEPRSMLEKVAGDFRFVPYFMNKAMEETEALERMKLLVTWYICSLQLEPQMLKPFNPILGETFQGMIGEYEIIVEQISHHPPISAFQLWNNTAKNSPVVDGFLAFEASTGISTISGYKHGEIRFYFPDTKQKIVCHAFPE
jgi:hypothetical protein